MEPRADLYSAATRFSPFVFLSRPAMALLELTDVGGTPPLRAAESLLRATPEGDAFAELLQHPNADPLVIEACGRAWLRGRRNRYDLDPDTLVWWLERAGVVPRDRD